MFHTVINKLSKVLGGAKRPRLHTIVVPVITHLRSKIHIEITNRVRIKFKVLINIVEHGYRIVMNDEDVVNITQDVGELFISVNVNFRLDPHFQVGWARVVTHMSHTVIPMLA